MHSLNKTIASLLVAVCLPLAAETDNSQPNSPAPGNTDIPRAEQTAQLPAAFVKLGKHWTEKIRPLVKAPLEELDFTSEAREKLDNQKILNSALGQDFTQLTTEQNRYYNRVKSITNNVLAANNWNAGIQAAIEQYDLPTVYGALGLALPKPKEKKPVTANCDLKTRQQQITKLGASFDKTFSAMPEDVYFGNRSKTRRATFDAQVIVQLLTSADFSCDLSALSKALTEAGDDYQRLYETLTVLHIYLNPLQGLSTIHLGMHLPDQPTFTNEPRYEANMNQPLDEQSEKLANTHLNNLAQSIGSVGYKNILDTLESILTQHAPALLTLDKPQKETGAAKMLTVVLFDLYKLNQNNTQPTERITKMAALLDDHGELWNFRTCWQWLSERSQALNTRMETCKGLLKIDTLSANLKTALDRELNADEDKKTNWRQHSVFRIKHHWSYAGSAIRVMTGKPLLWWQE